MRPPLVILWLSWGVWWNSVGILLEDFNAS
jgi:hypothetical protein